MLVTDKVGIGFNPIGESTGLESPTMPTAEVLPLTSFTFEIPAIFLKNFSGTIEGLSVVCHYDTLSGERVEITTTATEESLKDLRAVSADLLAQYKSGSLNKARASFHLPAV